MSNNPRNIIETTEYVPSLSEAQGVWKPWENLQGEYADKWWRVHPIGQVEFTTPGTYTWVAPSRVLSVNVVAIGGGGAGFSANVGGPVKASGGGAGLGWKNNISVIPGQSYTVVVGLGGRQSSLGGSTTNGQDSYFIQADNSLYATGKGGGSGTSGVGGSGGSFFGDGGGSGGNGVVVEINASQASAVGGGGAGGYSGNGASAVNTGSGPGVAAPVGSGAGGSGGQNGNGGGGVGIYGRGADGDNYGGGGSGGTRGGFFGASGTYGGGGSTHYNQFYTTPAGGAVRIIWGTGRAFPDTLTANL